MARYQSGTVSLGVAPIGVNGTVLSAQARSGQMLFEVEHLGILVPGIR